MLSEARRAYNRDYYQRNREKWNVGPPSEASRAASRRYHQRNREKRNAANRIWLANNKERNEAIKLAWRNRNKNHIMLYGAKQRAKRDGLECTITLADIIMPPACPLLGIPLAYGQRRGGAVNGSPTLDRIDNSKGYVPGNVWVISYRANKIKNDATLEELFLLARKLSEKLETCA